MVLHQTVSLSEVLENIRLSNNGYAFSSCLHPEYARRAQQLVDRGVLVKGRIPNAHNEIEDAFFTPLSAKVHAHLINFV